MAAIVRFDLPASQGINNRTRSDVQVGDTVTITNVSPGILNTFLLYASPEASSAVLVGVAPGSRTITIDAPGTYRIYLEVDGDVVIHTFKVLTENLLLDIPSHNEEANETANLTNIAANPGFIEESESNENDDYKGWHPAYERNWLILEQEVFKKTGDNSLIFNTGYTPSLFPEGLVFWNGTDHTLNLITGQGPILQVGQESYLPFAMGCNESGSIIPNGKVVYLSDDGSKITIELANSSDPDIVNKVVGITTQSIADGGCGFVSTYGLVRGVNTSMYSLGDTLYVSPTTDGELQNTRPSGGDFPIPIITVTEIDALDGVYFVHYLDVQTPDDLNDKTGFPEHNQTTPYRNTTVTFSDSSPDRTFSIQPTAPETDFYVWQLGIKYIRTGDTIQIPDEAGLYVFYYNEGTLYYIKNPTSSDLSTAIRLYVLVAYVYWDGTEHNYIGNERHGFNMASDTHAYLHFTRGAQWVDGLALNGITLGDGSLNAHAQFGIDFGVSNDEDIILISGATVKATDPIPIFYLDGAIPTMKRIYEIDTVPNPDEYFPVLTSTTAGIGGTGRLVWNELTGGSWQLTEVGNLKFVLCHIFGSNDIEQPHFAIIGQTEYNTVNAARTGAETEIANVLALFPQEEFVPIATTINQTSTTYTNHVKAKIVQDGDGNDWTDWRSSELRPGGVAPTDHNALAGLVNIGTPADNAHLGDLSGLTEETSPAAGDYWLMQRASDGLWRMVKSSNLPGGGGASSPLTTKGDIWAYDTADNRFTIAGVPDNYVLTKDAAATFGFKWAPATGGGGGVQTSIGSITGATVDFIGSKFVTWSSEVYLSGNSIYFATAGRAKEYFRVGSIFTILYTNSVADKTNKVTRQVTGVNDVGNYITCSDTDFISQGSSGSEIDVRFYLEECKIVFTDGITDPTSAFVADDILNIIGSASNNVTIVAKSVHAPSGGDDGYIVCWGVFTETTGDTGVSMTTAPPDGFNTVFSGSTGDEIKVSAIGKTAKTKTAGIHYLTHNSGLVGGRPLQWDDTEFTSPFYTVLWDAGETFSVTAALTASTTVYTNDTLTFSTGGAVDSGELTSFFGVGKKVILYKPTASANRVLATVSSVTESTGTVVLTAVSPGAFTSETITGLRFHILESPSYTLSKQRIRFNVSGEYLVSVNIALKCNVSVGSQVGFAEYLANYQVVNDPNPSQVDWLSALSGTTVVGWRLEGTSDSGMVCATVFLEVGAGDSLIVKAARYAGSDDATEVSSGSGGVFIARMA